MSHIPGNAGVALVLPTLCGAIGPQLRSGGAQQSPYFDDLKKAEEAAQLAGLGVWTKVGG